MLLFILVLVGGGIAGGLLGSIVGRWVGRTVHGDGTVKTVETVEDTESNLQYRIALGRTSGFKGRVWFWMLEAQRLGTSRMTGEMTVGPLAFEVEGIETDKLGVGMQGSGGPYPTRDDALSDALRALEELR